MGGVVVSRVSHCRNFVHGFRSSVCAFTVSHNTLRRVRRSNFGILRQVHGMPSPHRMPTAVSVNVDRGMNSIGSMSNHTHTTLSVTLNHNNSRIYVVSNRDAHFFNNGATNIRGGAHIHTHIMSRTVRRLVVSSSGVLVVKRRHRSCSTLNNVVNMTTVTQTLNGSIHVTLSGRADTVSGVIGILGRSRF